MAISNIHHPLILAFGILGNIISFFVYLAPLPTFYRICNKKSTESFQSLPYLTALISSMLWFYYALLKKNAMPMITINSFGIVVETLYIAVYIAYATRKARILTIKLFVLMILGLFSLILLVVQVIVKRDSLRVPVLGWICAVVSITVFAAPLTILARVIRTKSVEFMTFNLSFSLTLSAIIWFAYGLLQEDICIALPNTVGFVLGLVQMLLYAFYRKNKRPAVIEDVKQPEHVKNMVILSPTRNSEVFPVDIKPDSYNINGDDVKNNNNNKVDEKDHEGEHMHEQTEKGNEISMKFALLNEGLV